MKFVVVSSTPGTITLPSGSLTSSNTLHSCACRGLAASTERPAGRALRRMAMMSRRVGPLVVAPADVKTHALRRQPGHRVVERLDVHGGDLLELRERQVLELIVPAGREVGPVELEHEAGADDGGVLALEDLRQCADVRLVGGIVAVQQEAGGLARRDRRHEDLVGAGLPGGLREA